MSITVKLNFVRFPEVDHRERFHLGLYLLLNLKRVPLTRLLSTFFDIKRAWLRKHRMEERERYWRESQHKANGRKRITFFG